MMSDSEWKLTLSISHILNQLLIWILFYKLYFIYRNKLTFWINVSHKFFIDVQPITSQAISDSVVVGCDTHPYQKRGSLGRQWFRFRWARAFFLFRTNSWSRILTSVLATAPDREREIQRDMGSSVTKGFFPNNSIYHPILKALPSVLHFCTVPHVQSVILKWRLRQHPSILRQIMGFYLQTCAYRVHNLASEFHWNSTETTAVLCNSPHSAPSLSSITTLIL